MHTSLRVAAAVGALLFQACEKPEPVAPSGGEAPVQPPQPAAPAVVTPHPEEIHFGGIVQLTAGGENAEAYWSFDGSKLIYQAHEGDGCDQIYVRDAHDPKSVPTRV